MCIRFTGGPNNVHISIGKTLTVTSSFASDSLTRWKKYVVLDTYSWGGSADRQKVKVLNDKGVEQWYDEIEFS